MGGSHRQSRIGKEKVLFFPAFSLVRVSRKETLKESEIAIKLAPQKQFSANFGHGFDIKLGEFLTHRKDR